MIQALGALLLLVLAVYVYGVVSDYINGHWIFFLTAFWLTVVTCVAGIGLLVYRWYQRYSSPSRTAFGFQTSVTTSFVTSRITSPFGRKPASVPNVAIETTPISFRDFLKPIPDQLKKPIKGRSSTAGEFYDINLVEQTCTCANWQTERCRYPAGDIRRLCKHLVRLCEKHDLFEPDIGWLRKFGLLPFWTGPYCVEEVSTAMGSFRALRYKGARSASVVAPTGWKNRPEGCFSMFVEDFRWCHEWPPSSKWLKPAFVTWLRSPSSSVFTKDPKLTPDAIEARKFFDEQSRKEGEQAASLTTCCFNCGHQMRALRLTPKGNIRCPKCGAANYVAGNGSLHNPERIALYAHYDGNYDDRTRVGVVPAVLARQEQEIQKVDLDRKAGRLTADQSKVEKHRIRAKYKPELEALSAEKAAALDKIKERERAMKPVSSLS